MQAAGAAAGTAGEGPLLRLERVTLRYRTERRLVTAALDVELEVMQGERVVLLGPSGCGKTSLLKAVGGFLRPAAGRILLNGRVVQRPGPDRMVVFQEFDQLPPWKTVLGNVVFPMRASRRCGRAEARERALACLDKVGLRAFADAYPHTLSGGMKQRVAIARALAMEPTMLLMDEPFAALDALTRRRMQDELLALWRAQPFTCLFVTHSIEEAVLIGSRIVVMSAHPGRITATLAAAELERGASGSPGFQATVRHLHALLLDEKVAA